jgi:hypothetical protein
LAIGNSHHLCYILLHTYNTYACYQAAQSAKAVGKAKVAVATTEGELLTVKALQEWSLALVAAADAELSKALPVDEHDDDKKQRKVSASQKLLPRDAVDHCLMSILHRVSIVGKVVS